MFAPYEVLLRILSTSLVARSLTTAVTSLPSLPLPAAGTVSLAAVGIPLAGDATVVVDMVAAVLPVDKQQQHKQKHLSGAEYQHPDVHSPHESMSSQGQTVRGTTLQVAAAAVPAAMWEVVGGVKATSLGYRTMYSLFWLL